MNSNARTIYSVGEWSPTRTAVSRSLLRRGAPPSKGHRTPVARGGCRGRKLHVRAGSPPPGTRLGG